jgi:hypothetical protein
MHLEIDPELMSRCSGFPNLEKVQSSIRLLFKSLSRQEISAFGQCQFPQSAREISDDLVLAVHRIASRIVEHLRLPKACIIVRFQKMPFAGQVELSSEDDYLVALNERYRYDHRDIAGILAHEITHVFLYRKGISFPDTFENEVLTDTAATLLGVGHLTLDTFRVTQRTCLAPPLQTGAAEPSRSR